MIEPDVPSEIVVDGEAKLDVEIVDDIANDIVSGD